ncbi:MAG: MFS transporter [Propionibacteriaceae bacterium]|nr:MFS transporter [Propionibacteriaceae bacterium]
MNKRIALLTVCMFVIGTDGYVTAGLLPDIAQQARVSTTAAGQLVTVFALAYAILAPVSASLLGNVNRRAVLAGSLAVFVCGNILVACTTVFPVLVAGRLVAAAGAATFSPAAITLAGRLAPAESRGKVLAYVSSGLTIATIVGVPLGTLLGSVAGFQLVFWVIAAAGLLVGALVATRLGSVPPDQPIGLRDRFRTVTRPGAPAALAVTLLVFVAAFTVYTYIGDFFAQTSGLTGHFLSIVLLVFGLGGAAGNLVGGHLTDRIGATAVVACSLGGLVVAFVGLTLVGSYMVPAFVLTAVWGVSGWLLAPAQQYRLVQIGGPAAGLLVSINSSAMYLGMAVSGVLGGAVISLTSARYLPLTGTIAAVAGLVILATAYKNRQTGEHTTP